MLSVRLIAAGTVAPVILTSPRLRNAVRRPGLQPTRTGRARAAAAVLSVLMAGTAAGCAVPGPGPGAEPDRDRGGRATAKVRGDAAAGEQGRPRAEVRRAREGDTIRVTLADAVASLPVRPEHGAGYDRDLFDHWVDADGNGCDTRQEVLLTQNRSPRATIGSYCDVVDGEWFSYYDQVSTTDASTFDVDHLVPLAEAWASGAYDWSSSRRTAYANDLGDRRALIAVTASSNRTKSDGDPTEWLPAHQRCVYVSSWVAIKLRWRLTVDQAEASTLRELVSGCGERRTTVTVADPAGGGTGDARPSDRGAMPESAPTPTRAPRGGTDPRFAYCSEATAAGYGDYVRGRDREYRWYEDADGDGVVCER